VVRCVTDDIPMFSYSMLFCHLGSHRNWYMSPWFTSIDVCRTFCGRRGTTKTFIDVRLTSAFAGTFSYVMCSGVRGYVVMCSDVFLPQVHRRSVAVVNYRLCHRLERPVTSAVQISGSASIVYTRNVRLK